MTNELNNNPESVLNQNEINTIQVTTLADTVNPDDEETSLREAISNAVNGNTITFANGLSGGTINIESELTINKSITINGDITGNQQTADITINGQNNSRIFNIDDENNSSFSNIFLSGLNLINGKVTGFSYGGGIFNRENLSLNNSNISGNSARYGGGVYSSNGTASFTNTTISGNSASYFGGGIESRYGTASFSNTTISGNSARYGGGIYSSNGTASFTNTTISGNSASRGGGVYSTNGTASFSNTTISGNSARYGGGVYSTNGTASFSNTTISGNSARYGGGVYSTNGTTSFTNTTISGNSASVGGGVYSTNGTTSFTNTTISGNSASVGGGVYSSGGVYFNYTLALFTNTTISGNSASVGGGVRNFGRARFTSTILSGNQNPDLSNSGTIISNGHNLVGTGDIGLFKQPGDLTNITNPRLGPLANNGGPTLTHAILAGSPAIDAGSNPNNLPYDQRGIDFLRTKGTATDIGAFESDFRRLLGTLGRDNLIDTPGSNVIIGLTSRDTLTGGGGNDIFAYNHFTDAGDIITDFRPGEDLLDFNRVMHSIGYLGSNPIDDGYITFSRSDSNTLVNIDSDGPNPPGIAPPVAFILLQNVQPSALGINNFVPFS